MAKKRAPEKPPEHGHYQNPYRRSPHGWEVNSKCVTVWINDIEFQWSLPEDDAVDLTTIGERLIAAGHCVTSLAREQRRKAAS